MNILRNTPILTAMLAVALAGTAISALGAGSKSKHTKEEPVYELPKTGKNIRRSDGWLNVEAVDTRFVVKFFDKEMKPVPPDVERGFALFRYPAKGPARAPLSNDGTTLATPAVLRPPHNFLAILNLFVAGKADPAETYTFKYP